MPKASELAIKSVKGARNSFCKFLSANDTGATGGHQSGILVSKSASGMMFQEYLPSTGILKREVKITWPNGMVTTSRFTYYSSKRELRITSFGRNFSFLRPDQAGSLFVLTEQDWEDYSGFFLDTDAEIDEFMQVLGISPTQTNALINYIPVTEESHELELKQLAEKMLRENHAFPTTEQMSAEARVLRSRLFKEKILSWDNPDQQLINWTDEEFKLFRAVENVEYGGFLCRGFDSVDDFTALANRVLNRRKSRAGKSLEHHLAALFDENSLEYTAQARTEGKKVPDFIFPSEWKYHDMTFPADKLISLAAKTTCKDRWRQVITEADRIPVHHLCTLQQGVSEAQMDEMQSENVILVVPKPYISAYPKNKRDRIWTLKKFIDFVKEKEGIQ